MDDQHRWWDDSDHYPDSAPDAPPLPDVRPTFAPETAPPAFAPTDRPARRKPNLLKEILQFILIVALLRVGMDTLLPRYVVDGASMEPTFHTSERVIVDRVTMLFSAPARGDVIVLDSPNEADDLLIKRVIGLPGEHVAIQDGRVYIDDQRLDEPYVAEYCTYRSCNGEWQLGPDEYFVLGDNRSHSLDSHSFGPIQESAIKGVARVRYWPPAEVDILSAPDYK